MPVTTSQIFDFLDRHRTCSIEKYEMYSADFGILRLSMRSIVLSLRESDDIEAHDISDRLRMLLSEWLTVPVPFDGGILDAVQTLGDPDAIETRWGRNVRASYDAALSAAQNLPLNESPVRAKLLSEIQELRAQGGNFKIYCHRRSSPHFQSLFAERPDVSLGANAFLHSVKDYREAEPFDVLIKVGPLRAGGWGSAPDAIITAPRFTTLVQIVWSGCGDEPDFAYDPVAASVDPATTSGNLPTTDQARCINGISWISSITRLGDDVYTASGASIDTDELRIFRDLNQPRENRRAVLVQIDEEHGILYPPQSQVLSFDPAPDSREPLGRRLPGETLVEGMFIVRPLLHDLDLGGLQAEHGHYSRIWKARLFEESQKDAENLRLRLRDAGLNLMHLRAAISNWCKLPTTVIHAPQQRWHFEILIGVLGVNFDGNGNPRHQRVPWWQYAWNEIARSRGEAIQAGFHGQEFIEEQLLVILNDLLPEIRIKAAKGEGFSFLIPPGRELQGAALFNNICLVEMEFLAPDAELKLVRELNTIEQWRV